MDSNEAGRSGLIRFTLDGAPFELSRDEVDQRLRGVGPESSARHGVLVNQTWYPVKQALEVALGIPRLRFTSEAARRHLAALGYPLRGQAERRGRAAGPSAEPSAEPEPPVWHTEDRVQSTLVTALATTGWRIISAANTATRERGVDVLAERDGRTAGVEVKGYPTRGYADPARAGEVKPTNPGSQAGHWYAQAILAAMRLRTRRPELDSVIALPDFPRYRDLVAETWTSLQAAGIDVWWVHEDGTVAPHGDPGAA